MEREKSDKRDKRDSFEIEDRIPIKIDRALAFELAIVLSEYDVSYNPALDALGRSLWAMARPYKHKDLRFGDSVPEHEDMLASRDK